jgi:ABC-2 type transport system ATP-binding protein
VRTYSHGMRARLALAQALLPGPRLLILDEPGDGLDPEGIHEMRQTILRLQRELGLTILLSSHYLSEVEQLCTTIAVLNQGRLVFEGAMGNVKEQARRVRLVTSDFAAAAAVLRSAGLIETQFGTKWVVPSPGVGADNLVKFLVQREMPVFEIVREERSLEDFYLALMNGEQESPAAPGEPARTPTRKST